MSLNHAPIPEIQSEPKSESAHLMGAYAPLPIHFTSGKGCWLKDENGTEYLDAISGIAVTNLGHSVTEINNVLLEQANKLWHVSNTVNIKEQQLLGEKLCQLAKMDKAFFCNSGSEANETALKLARLHGHKKGIKDPQVLIMSGAFHGRTLAMLSATDSPNAQKGFGPLVEGFLELPFNNLTALQELEAKNKNIVAVLIEPIQGESGVRIANQEYMQALRDISSKNDWLLMVDEIQAGVGRTGTWFSYQHYNIQPDVITLAKALGNGFPIGACLASGAAAELFTPGSHGSTFGGNPLACCVATAVLESIESQSLLKQAKVQGQHIIAQLKLSLAGINEIKEIRGKGLLIGIEFEEAIDGLQIHAMENERLLINITRHKTIRILPALNITDAEVSLLIERLIRSISNFLSLKLE